jgi:uncharacterized phage protein gp47/JayE
MTFGLTTTGFVPKRQSDIIDEMQQAFRAEFGEQVDLDARRPFGQLIGILSERLATLWALSEGCYYSKYPRTAQGISLDNAVSLTGLTRLAATMSMGEITITGTVGLSIPAGFTVAVTGDATAQFVTTTTVVIGGGGTVVAPIRAVTAGALVALAGTITVIVNPLTGVDSVTNAADVTVGRNRETDSELRIRQQEFLQAPGTSSVEGIRAAIALVPDVAQVIVIENDTNGTVDGRPPKSFEAYVDGGTDLAIAEAIWQSKAAGIETVGTESVVITDSQGIDRTVKFSRPIEVEITVDVTITANSDLLEDDLYPANGDDLVRDAVLAYGNSLTIGRDVFINKMFTNINAVPGVVGVTITAYRDMDPPVSDFIPIVSAEVAKFDSSRITVTSS